MFFSLFLNHHCSLDISIKHINCQLLEATARAIQPVLEWGESGLAVADGLSNLLKVNTDPSLIRPIELGSWLNIVKFAIYSIIGNSKFLMNRQLITLAISH